MNYKVFNFSYLELSDLPLACCMLYPLYVSLSCNHSNHKVTRLDKIFSADYKDDMVLLKQYFLSNGMLYEGLSKSSWAN